jgi:SAM-dependent MidA family methyltransferase
LELKRKIVDLIKASGPIPVADFMAICLLDPRHGYYTTQQPFGAGGDFITAPEISQMFGELVGVWIYSAWKALGEPVPVTVAEIGPGRGTLFADMFRTFKSVDPSFAAEATYVLIEPSSRLETIQSATLAAAGADASWLDRISEMPPQPALVVGNEVFDALPVHQYVMTRDGWRERCIGLGDDDALLFAAGAGRPDPDSLPPGADECPPGAIVELAPARTALMQEFAGFLGQHGGAGLFFDYGYRTAAIGETLQAVRDHHFDDPLARPGQADLTAHVDFASLCESAEALGFDTQVCNQGDFLLKMGLLERAGTLGHKADDESRKRIETEVDRLAGADQMGELFKVMAVLPRGTRIQPFGDPD